MLLTELRTRQCLRPSRHRCEAKKGVQRHPHRRNCLNRVWRVRGWSLSGSPKCTMAPRKNEVKQQQDWRLVFVDRPETFQIIDCLDELMNTRECFHRDLLSRSICVAACLPEISQEVVRLRSIQAGPASLVPERVPKAGSKDSVVRLAPRSNEVKQQQDWRLVFVDRPETNGITDRLDELMGENVGFDRDLMSRSICAGGLSVVCPRSVCEGSRLDQNWAWRAWLSALLKRRCFLTANAAAAQATTRNAAAAMKGCKHAIEGGNFDVLISAHCKTGCDRYATQRN